MLKRDLNENELKSAEKFENIRTKLEQENKFLNEQLQVLNSEYKEKFEQLQSQQNQETKTLLDSLAKENEAKIADLKQKHLEDLKNQTVAQKAAITSLKSSLENSKALELEVQEQAHNKKLGKFLLFFFFFLN